MRLEVIPWSGAEAPDEAALGRRLAEEGYDMHLDLDVNTDLWPLELGERFTFALASTLSLDGAPDAGAHTRHGKHRTATARMQVALAAYGTH